MNSLYALKPWFSDQLTGLRGTCVAHGVRPSTLTAAGVLAGGAAGLALAAIAPGPLAAVVVGTLLVVRLGCANLDGGVARESGQSSPWGSVQNELGDRVADLVMLAGLAAFLPLPWVGCVMLAATLPSWAALAGAAAGALRRNGGPMGKTERCAVVVVIALTGQAALLAAVMGVGAVVTAAVRLVQVRGSLVGAR
jgi:CDP-diacylglycerol--glycerol-3-phosphate 3-phosphatidyltransferase